MEPSNPSSTPQDKGKSSDGYTLGPAHLPPSPEQNIKPNTIVDDFLILNTIGSGGFGVVYRARQLSIPQDVALKVLRPSLAIQTVIERFEQEKAILGDLDNEHIVGAIRGGQTSAELGGCPFFAMKFVDGQPITRYADNGNLSVPKRLELFLQVCDAIEHAHEKDVIHRDLKPSNILVMEKDDGEPLVKVIDFGVAKTVNNGLPLAYPTQTGQAVGTAAYMSPQQTGEDPDLVNKSSDIYSLGVLLYELLTGQLPLDITGNDSDWIVKLREVTPEKPSARIKLNSSQTNSKIAKRRGTNPAQLKNILEGELDRIVMKCLEKAPEDRYDEVGDLVEDIESCKHLLPSSDNPRTRLGIKQVVTVLACTIIALLVAGGIYGYLRSRPDFSTPEGFLKAMCQPQADVKYDSEIKGRSTLIGHEVWEYLKTNSWYLGWGVGKIVDLRAFGRRRELDMKYETSDGVHHIAVIFFVETNILKFHDVYIYESMGTLCSNYLSTLIIDPKAFKESADRYNHKIPDAPKEDTDNASAENAQIFYNVVNAQKAPDFEGAQIILAKIDPNKITDADLASYYAMALEIAEFCPKVGIPRNADPSWSKILNDVDFVALARQSVSHPIDTVATALKIKRELSTFDSLTAILVDRYGPHTHS